MFKTADPTRRVPTFLQAYTKENFVFQLTAATLLIVGCAVKDEIQERRLIERWTKNTETTES